MKENTTYNHVSKPRSSLVLQKRALPEAHSSPLTSSYPTEYAATARRPNW